MSGLLAAGGARQGLCSAGARWWQGQGIHAWATNPLPTSPLPQLAPLGALPGRILRKIKASSPSMIRAGGGSSVGGASSD